MDGARITFEVSPKARRLKDAEKEQFARDGFVKNLPLFSESGVRDLQAMFDDMAARLPQDTDINRVNMWHKASRQMHDLCRVPALLDYVEDLIGPVINQWGCQWFVKYPGDGSIVPWHQDAQFWPLRPHRTVTVWLAIYDTDVENGAMQIIPGSHQQGGIHHDVNDAPHLLLNQEIPDELIDYDNVVTMDLKAGEISLHDDGLLHGSLANNSDRRRSGLTMRFYPPDVQCNLEVWPTFEAYPARGEDTLRLNPVGKVPEGEGAPGRMFQHSSEFA